MEEYKEIGARVLEALALGLLIPLFAPVLQFFDSSRKHAETRRKLELIKLVAEVDEVTGVCGDNRSKVFSEAVTKIAEESDEVQALLSGAVKESPELDYKPFTKRDAIAATIIPLVFSLIGLEEGWKEFSILLLVSSTLSLLSAKYFICKIVRSGKWQLFWHLFISTATLLPAIVVVVLLE